METGDFRHTESKLSRTGRFWIVVCLVCLIRAQLALAFPPGAITCQNNIYFGGNNVTVDSFDSSDPAHSYWLADLGYGVYTNTGIIANPYRKANGNLATTSQTIGAMNIGNGIIWGHVDTKLGGSVTLAGLGSVGDISWAPDSLGIQPGYASNDMNAVFPVVTLPSTNWVSLANNTSITNSGYYTMSEINNNMTFSGGTNPINVTLYLTNGITLSSSRIITIGTNATVTIYAGVNIAIFPNASIINTSRHASQFVIYGLPNISTMHLNGRGSFWGLIYAPNAIIGVAGGYYGALVCYDVICIGNTTFSYDESLSPILSTLLATATLSASNNPTNGQFDLKVAGYPGFNYAIESSTNLANWVSVTTNAAPFTFSETNTGDWSQHFFRAIYLP